MLKRQSSKQAPPSPPGHEPEKGSTPVVIRPRPLSAQVDAVGRELGDDNAFVTIDNNIHFHPDLTFGGFGILILTTSSELRSPGVYFFHRPTHEWKLAYELTDLPQGQWARLADWEGAPVPVDLFRVNDQVVCARWLGRSGSSVPPGRWDRTGGPSEQERWAAEQESAMIQEHIRGIR
jgi:hypothetical protein